MDGRSSSPHIKAHSSGCQDDFLDVCTCEVGAAWAESSARLSAAVGSAAGAAETAGHLLLPPMKRVARLGPTSQPLLLPARSHTFKVRAGTAEASRAQPLLRTKVSFFGALFLSRPLTAARISLTSVQKDLHLHSAAAIQREDVWSVRVIKTSPRNERLSV